MWTMFFLTVPLWHTEGAIKNATLSKTANCPLPQWQTDNFQLSDWLPGWMSAQIGQDRTQFWGKVYFHANFLMWLFFFGQRPSAGPAYDTWQKIYIGNFLMQLGYVCYIQYEYWIWQKLPTFQLPTVSMNPWKLPCKILFLFSSFCWVWENCN